MQRPDLPVLTSLVHAACAWTNILASRFESHSCHNLTRPIWIRTMGLFTMHDQRPKASGQSCSGLQLAAWAVSQQVAAI